MTLLALDTATRATAVALCALDRDRPALEGRDDPDPGQRPRHVTRLLPLIAQLLERSGGAWSEIDRIAVGRGPGTFTGLRIGMATARALGQSLGVPLVGVSTLESLGLNHAAARAEPASAPSSVLAVLDARRREVFAAAWALPADGRPDDEPGANGLGKPLISARPIAPEGLAELIPSLGARPLALGDGAVEFREILERAGALIPVDASELHRVTAINHCRLATGRPGSAPDDVQPEYLRLPDAEVARRASP